MAKVLNPLNSVDASGSVGGLTYRRWRGIKTVCNRPLPARRHRGLQPFNRALLGFLSREWGLLTDEQRQLWRDYATEHPYPDGFGGTFILTGNQMYNALNHNAMRILGLAKQQDEPPIIDPAASMVSLVAETGAVDPGEIDLSWDHVGIPSNDDRNEIWISPPLGSEGKVNVDSRMRHRMNLEGEEVVVTVKELVEGAWYWFKTRYMDQFGQKTAWQWSHATPKLTP